MVEPPLSSETLERLSAVLTESLGLAFHGDRLQLLQRRMTSAAGELNFNSIKECAESLISSTLSRKQIEILAKYLTVGETYFFRDPGVFEKLEKQILPQLIRQRQSTTRTIRLWSAACCTGEEAYSLAMLVDKLLPDPSEWNVSILATDINPEFVKRGKSGIYNARSLRAMPDLFRSQYMKRVDSRRYEVAQHLKSNITFSWMNLIESSSMPPMTPPFDIIFCRNVFIYFATLQMRKVLMWVSQNLDEDGYLFVAPNEVFCASSDFEIENLEDVMTLKKRTRVRELDETPASEENVSSKNISQGRSAIQKNEDTDNFLLMSRSSFRRGDLASAIKWCERAIEKEPLNPSAYFLMGMIARERNDADEAIAYMKRVLFLEPQFIMAQFSLANLMLQEGKSEQARKHFKSVLRLLDNRDNYSVLPESDGVTAATMKAIVGAVLEDFSMAHSEPRPKEGGGTKNVHRG